MPAQTGFEDLGFTSAQPTGGFEELGFVQKGAPKVAAPPNVEDLRAQKYGTVSPAELRAQHQANYEYENPNLLQSASRMAEGFTQGVGNLVSGIGALGKQVYDVAKAPAASMQNFTNVQNPGPMARLGNTLAGMGPADLAASAGTQAGKYIYGTPEEAGEVLGENLPALAAPELTRTALKPVVGAATVMQKFTPSARAATFSQRATNQLVAGLQPKNVKVLRAVESAAPDLHAYMESQAAVDPKMAKAMRQGKAWKDAREFSNVANDAASDFYEKNYQPLADDVAKIDPTITTDLERRSVINKTLGRLGYFDKSPLARSMARTSPQVQGLVDELNALKSSLNTRFDQLAPTNTGAGKILRRYADLKEVGDRAAVQADRIDLAKAINKGEASTAAQYLGSWVKDAGITVGTAGFNPKLFSRWFNILQNEAKSGIPLFDRDKLFARAAQNWPKGTRAFKGAHQPIVRVEASPPATTATPTAPAASSTEISPVPQPPPISGGSTTGYPANTNPITGAIAGSAETPAQRAQSLYEAQLQMEAPPLPEPISVPTDIERRIADRRAASRIAEKEYTGQERRAYEEIPSKEIEKINDYKRRQKAATVYRKYNERRKSPR